MSFVSPRVLVVSRSVRGSNGAGDVSNLAQQARRGRRVRGLSRPRCPRAWWCSTPCTRSRPTRRRDLACRWNCKAGKCGSCSAEINGRPRLMCMTRLNTLDLTQPVTVEPMRAFPLIKDLVTDVSWNFRVKQGIQPLQAAQARRAGRHLADGAARRRPRAGVPQVHRVLPVPGRLPRAARPRQARRVHRPALPHLRAPRSRCTRSTPPTACRDLKDAHGIGYCNITKCCTKVCPEHIHITDNAIIPLKERVVDRFYDPVTRLLRMFR